MLCLPGPDLSHRFHGKRRREPRENGALIRAHVRGAGKRKVGVDFECAFFMNDPEVNGIDKNCIVCYNERRNEKEIDFYGLWNGFFLATVGNISRLRRQL